MAKDEKNKRGFFHTLTAKLTNHFNHGEDLKEKATIYEHLFEKYKELLEATTKDTVELYNLRKEVYYTLLRFQTYVNALSGCPSIIINGANLAVRKSSVIKLAMDEEATQEFKQESNSTSNVLLGSTAAGSALAIGGPSALIAIATTFGTAGSGAVISSLSGAAATNAALAWIGGGTIAAGGAGMSGGAAVLGLMGPIGWSIAGLSAFAYIGLSVLKGNENLETINMIDEEIMHIRESMNELKVARNSIKSIKDYTETNLEILKNFLDNLSITEMPTNDYCVESYPQKKLFMIANVAKNLGKVSNQSVLIKK